MAQYVSLTAPAGFFDRSWADLFAESLYLGADELGQLEQYNVMARTPVLTGALQSDVSYKVGPKSDNVIVEVYSDTTNQLDEWGRVYMLYQEGGALGLETYTNDPHEMYARILTDDLDQIVAWGEGRLNLAAVAVATGKGIP